MRRHTLLAAAILLAAASTALAGSTHEANVAYLRALVDVEDADALVTMHDGRVLTLADALDEAARRADGVELAALMAGAEAGGPGKYFGDIWVIEMANGGCPDAFVGPAMPASSDAAPQTEIHRGGGGTMSSEGGYFTSVIAWTMKTSETASGRGWDAAGSIEPFCFSLFSVHLNMPFIDGVFSWRTM